MSIFKKSGKDIALYIAVVVISVLFLYFGNRYAAKDSMVFVTAESGVTVVKARVDGILNIDTGNYSLSSGSALENNEITFSATILGGERKGDVVRGTQGVQNIDGVLMSPMVRPGSRILIRSVDGQGDDAWQFLSLVRTDKLLILGILFLLTLLLFGRMKGLNTIISLAFSCVAIFAVFIPAILSGRNIYIASVIICIYTIVMTFLIIGGATRKTLAAILGCLGGITVAGLMTVIMDRVLILTGYVDEGSYELTYLFGETSINLRAIVFAAILIGALGAVMDVAMSIASSLWEVRAESGAPSFGSLFKSGMNIGRDVMGTMANTLILAYIGSSMSVVLLLCAYSLSLPYLLNREMIVVEILQALVGSFGILLTMPLTSVISAFIYTKTKKRTMEAR